MFDVIKFKCINTWFFILQLLLNCFVSNKQLSLDFFNETDCILLHPNDKVYYKN